MIHEVYSLLAAALRAKGMPFEFRYGPQQVPDKVGGTARTRPSRPAAT